MFGGNELKGAVLEGEEEEEYWNNFSKKKADKQARIAKNRRVAKVRGGRGRNGARNGETRGEKVNIQSIIIFCGLYCRFKCHNLMSFLI